MYVYMCRHVCVYEHDCFMYLHIVHLYVLYDCVQCCEDAVSVELRYINWIFFIVIIMHCDYWHI